MLVNEATLKQVEKFKYLGVAFTRDGRQDEELDTRKISKAGLSDTVMQVLHFSVVMKQKIVKKKSNALNFQNSKTSSRYISELKDLSQRKRFGIVIKVPQFTCQGKIMGKDKLDDLDCGSWMESLKTSHKQNDGVDERL